MSQLNFGFLISMLGVAAMFINCILDTPFNKIKYHLYSTYVWVIGITIMLCS